MIAMGDDCIFCKIANKEISSDLVFENDELVAFNDLDPKAPIHILFIPKRHIPTVNDLSEDDTIIVARIFKAIKEVAFQKGIAEDGYRVIANCNKHAGQEVFHLHFHLLGGRPFGWPPG